MHLRLEDLNRAWQAADPELIDYLERLVTQPDPEPATPVRDGALTFERFLQEMRGWQFRRKTRAEQEHFRREQLKALEAPEAEVPLPDRLRAHQILFGLWQQGSPFARQCLLEIIARVPLHYGVWKALKRIFKEAEAKGDLEVFAALAARFDAAAANHQHQVSQATMLYLARRAWRYLRRLGQTLPASYPDAAALVLAGYPEDTHWDGTWVANHIFYHQTRRYSKGTFYVRYDNELKADLWKNRAFAELWRRTPRPLFSLLERAKSDHVRDFAAGALKSDFRALLREVEPGWVVKLVRVGSAAVDRFVIWILGNVPRFEQGAFRELGLHDAVLKLFDSAAPEAQAYAAEYGRTHARDLPVPELVRLVNNNHEAVRKLARDLLQARHPRDEVGLDNWGRLLETKQGHKLAELNIKKHFGPRELTSQWFQERFLSRSTYAFEFAKALLPEVHPREQLGPTFFCELIDRAAPVEQDPNDVAGVIASLAEQMAEAGTDPNFLQSMFSGVGKPKEVPDVAGYALAELARFDVNTVDKDFLKRLFLNPLTQQQAGAWVKEGRLKIASLPVDYFKALAYHPYFDSDPWFNALRESGRPWARRLAFHESLADQVLKWMSDPRRFAPSDLGLAWLLELVARSEPRYHEFGVETLIRSFAPADFAPQGDDRAEFIGVTFAFAGKTAKQPREHYEELVKQKGGTLWNMISPNLHYLVVGDEGSALLGQGPKGSRQQKAEELNAAGANIAILTEAAFLDLLATRPAAGDATQAGCERLWRMAVAPGPGDSPIGNFARKYLLAHHPEMAAEENRKLAEGAEVPLAFYTFARARPLFFETRKPLRDFALELARWEFARWSPAADELIKLCEAPQHAVRAFVAEALLAEDSPENRRFRIDPGRLSAAAVFSFCESLEDSTRELGMQLIRRAPALHTPDLLFNLLESPDRKVRSFAIRLLWSLYRDRGITAGWKPAPAPEKDDKKKKERVDRGPGAPQRPEQVPIDLDHLRESLRRVLYELPGARPKPELPDEEITFRLKALSTRQAKLAMIEVIRDLALEELDFARIVLPLLEEFMASRGLSERQACLVAVTRIRHAHIELRGSTEAAS